MTDVNGDGKTDLGDTITWSFLVKNTGTTTVTTVAVNDPKAGAVTCPVDDARPGRVHDLHVRGVHDHPARRRRGPRRQHGDGVGQGPRAATRSPRPPSSTDTPVAQSPGLSLVKSAATHDVNGDFKVDLGDTITWSFLVKNTGTTTRHRLAVNDPKAGAVTCPVTRSRPGAIDHLHRGGLPDHPGRRRRRRRRQHGDRVGATRPAAAR